MRTKTRIPKAERFNGRPLLLSGWSRCDCYAVILGIGVVVSLTLSVMAICRDNSDQAQAIRELVQALRSMPK